MKLFKKRNKPQEEERERFRAIVREELEAHDDNNEKKKLEAQKERDKRELWDSLTPRTKRALLRRIGKHGTTV